MLTFCLTVGIIGIIISGVSMGVWTDGQQQRANFHSETKQHRDSRTKIRQFKLGGLVLKKLLSIVIIVFFIQIIAGCSESHTVVKLTNEGKLAKSYLEEKGYKVLSYQGNQTYKFSKSNLATSPYNEQLWSVQKNIYPDDFLDKKIDIETFYVHNHPLDKMYKSAKDYLGKTSVNVWIFKEKIIGGTSFPVFNKNAGIVGAPYSLEGKSGEEVQSDLNEWLKRWKEKYGTP
jgi:hypothetical protein